MLKLTPTAKAIHATIPDALPDLPYKVTRVSDNDKTGPIPVTNTAAQTCPDTCALKTTNAGGCYAAAGYYTMLHWRRLSEGADPRALDLQGLCEAIESFPRRGVWRLNEAGDLMHKGGTIDADTMRALTRANAGRRVIAYTHHARTPANLQTLAQARADGFPVNLSTDSAADADKAAKEAPGFPLVTLMAPDQWDATGKAARTPEGRPVVRCPHETVGIQCAECQLCANPDRASIVGFTAHGSGKRRVIAIVQHGMKG